MDASFDHGGICLGDDLQGLIVLSGNDFGNRLEAMFLIAGIDPLRRVTEREILAAAQTRCTLQDRRAFFLDGARIDGGFEDHDIPALEEAADGFRSTKNRTEIGSTRSIDWRRHCNDIEVRLRQRLRFASVNERRLRQLGFIDLMRAVEPTLQLFNPAAIDVEPDHPCAGAGERYRHRKPDIAETDDRDAASWRQNTSLLALVCGLAKGGSDLWITGANALRA